MTQVFSRMICCTQELMHHYHEPQKRIHDKNI
uniref:Uncharacterized protein MANES_15G041600 n=1 Tax=Rhizophora mucronata TaxID=61149 RepID=A0A2P2N675_RHIMU